MRGADAIGRLTKRDVERLLNDYDVDPVSALTHALAIVHDDIGAAAGGDAAFDGLVQRSDLDASSTAALLARDIRALDDLARSLNEQRGLA